MDQLTNESRYTANTAWLETRGAATWVRVLVPLLAVAVITFLAVFAPPPEPCNALGAEEIELAEACANSEKARTKVGAGPLSGLSLQAL